MSQQIVVLDDKTGASRRRSAPRPKPNILAPMDASPSNSQAA